ncbi:hypothetical protein EDB83DRAFT_2316232 [Lactarius deliciosus]|nr:hypothetical protein EDB83DRAFT_2316232 [Lactarius deliciosus]
MWWGVVCHVRVAQGLVVAGALHAALKGCGRVLACVGVGVVDGVGAGGGWALHAALRQHGGLMGSCWWGLGLPCWVSEVGWQWQSGRAGWRWFACMNGLQSPGSCVLCWGGEVLCAMLGQQVGGGSVLGWG